jgi:hypothetical protein
VITLDDKGNADPTDDELAYAPAPNFHGTDTFNYVVSDTVDTDAASVTITVSSVNDDPTWAPVPDRTDPEGSPVVVTFTATDVDGDPITYAAVGLPPGLVMSPTTGKVTGTPPHTAAGSYTVTVTASDGMGGSAVTTFTWTIGDVNLPPTATDATLAVLENTPATVTVTASDPDGDPLTYTPATPPAHGTVTATGPTFTYTPALGYSGGDSFVVVVSDGRGGTDTATVSVTVKDSNAAPVAAPDAYATGPGETLVVAAPGVLGNDFDPDADPISAALVFLPSRGTVSFASDGSFTYVPAGDGYATAFTYTTTDGLATTAPVTVTISVARANLGPSATDDAFVIDEDHSGAFDIFANDSDPEGDPFGLRAFTQPEWGRVMAGAQNLMSYVPPPDWHGETSFTYTIADAEGRTSTATVVVVVRSVNDEPEATVDEVFLDEYGTVVIGALDNDFDPEGDVVVLTSVRGLPHGSVSFLPNGTITYTPTVGWVGIDTLTYTIIDGNGGSSTATVVIVVDRAALDNANNLTDSVGTELGRFDGINTLPIHSIPGIELLTGAFFQSLDVLRIPLVLLAAAMVWALVLGMRWSTLARLLPFLAAARRRWSVVLVDREGVLPAYVEPDPHSEIAFNFRPVARYIEQVGKPRRVGATTWLKVVTPGGDGWVDASHLTEQVTEQQFADDRRPPALVERLVEDLAAGRAITTGPRGLHVIYGAEGVPVFVGDLSDPEDRQAVKMWRPSTAIHPAVESSFSEAVAEPFVATYSAPQRESTVDAPVLVSALIPIEFFNFHYLSYGEPGQLNSWMVFFEYVKGKPEVVGLVVDE